MRRRAANSVHREETNNERLFGGQNASAYVKDGINNYIVNGQQAATNPANIGTKASPVYPMTIGPGQTGTVRLRLTLSEPNPSFRPFADFDQIMADRLREADEFHDSITPEKVKADPDRASIMRQANAGMLWTKQYFYYDLATWLEEHNVGVAACFSDARMPDLVAMFRRRSSAGARSHKSTGSRSFNNYAELVSE